MSFVDLLATRSDLPWQPGTTINGLAGEELRLVMASGELRDFAFYARALTFQGQDCMLVAMVDITDRVRAEAHIAHLRDHDALTSLPNRHALEAEMALQLGRCSRSADEMAVICVDINHFKAINETHGHAFGDRLLKLIAARMKSSIRAGGVLARIGGNQFAVAEAGAMTPRKAETLARRMIDAIGRPFIIDGHSIVVSASVGIAMTPGDGETPEQLLKNADLALAGARADGAGVARFFESEMDLRAQARRRIESALRVAISDDVLVPFYQPQVCLRTGTIVGFEALMRWPKREGGFVSPAEFIPIAEETGQIGALSEKILRRACRDAMAWPLPVSVAVNLSPLQFKSGTLLATVMDVLRHSGLPAQRLELEITETVLMDRSEAVVATLHALRALGVRVALDDFGTGFSSLSYLRSFPFDKIKIDRAFVSNVTADSGQQTIVKAVIGIGEGLGMRVTAEGIETEDERDWLMKEGCHEGQGFLFSAARPQAEILSMMEAGATELVA